MYGKRFSLLLTLVFSLTFLPPAHAQSVVINEFMADNGGTLADPQGQLDDWIELFNPSSSPVSVGGMYLTDDTSNTTRWELPDTTLQPGDYLIVWADNDSTDTPGLHTNFRLGAGGEFIGLYASTAQGNGVVDSIIYPAQKTNVSYGRLDNGTGGFRFLVKPTPGTENYAPSVSAINAKVVINEIMASNTKTITDPQGRFADWFELYNMSDSAVSLFGSSLTDDPANPARWLFTDVVMGSGEYLIIWTDNDDTDPDGIHTSFRLNGENGEFVGLFYTEDSQTHAIDSVSFGPQKPDTSYGRYPNGSGGFRTLIPATPGKANKLANYSSLFGAVVINELLAVNDSSLQDAQGENDDWLELYNTTDSTISLSGMFLTDNPDNTYKWKFPNVSIAPGTYLIVWADEDTLDDFTGVHSNFKLSSGGEFLGLYDTEANGRGLVDSVYFGPQQADISYGRLTDGAPQFALFTIPTPGASNNTSTDIKENPPLPGEYVLRQNYPNPFNQGTVVAYTLPKTASVSVIIYNILGQPVRRLFDGSQPEGSYHLRWDGRDDAGTVVASGVYIYRLSTNTGFTAEKKMLLIK